MKTQQPRALQSYSRQDCTVLQKRNGKPEGSNPLHLKTQLFTYSDLFYFSLLPVICSFYGPDDLLCDWTCGSPKVS